MTKIFTIIAAVLLFVIPDVTVAGTTGWRSTQYGVEILAFPSTWKVDTSDQQSLHLTKKFEHEGMEFNERITVQVARDTYGSVENAVRELRGQGYFLADRTRLGIDSLGMPFWFMSRPAGDEESAWCALLLRAGLVYLVDLRASPLDPDALTDYGRLIENIRLLADPRETAWNALAAGDAGRAQREFRKLLATRSNDVNARYGLGLAYLADGRANDAVRELERVRPLLGLEEDVRRSLGRAELLRGHASRGVTLLVQALRADLRRDPELRPQILSGIRAAATARRSQASGSRLSLFAIEFLSQLTHGDSFTLESLRTGFNRAFDKMSDTCLANSCDADTLVELLAAVDFDQGILMGLAARAGANEDDLQVAEAKFADGFKTMTLLAR